MAAPGSGTGGYRASSAVALLGATARGAKGVRYLSCPFPAPCPCLPDCAPTLLPPWGWLRAGVPRHRVNYCYVSCAAPPFGRDHVRPLKHLTCLHPPCLPHTCVHGTLIAAWYPWYPSPRLCCTYTYRSFTPTYFCRSSCFHLLSLEAPGRCRTATHCQQRYAAGCSGLASPQL